MPCPLPEEEVIPIARYGNSNIGRLKYVYRQGLALRYGFEAFAGPVVERVGTHVLLGSRARMGQFTVDQTHLQR